MPAAPARSAATTELPRATTPSLADVRRTHSGSRESTGSTRTRWPEASRSRMVATKPSPPRVSAISEAVAAPITPSVVVYDHESVEGMRAKSTAEGIFTHPCSRKHDSGARASETHAAGVVSSSTR